MPTTSTWKQLAQRHLRTTADQVIYQPPSNNHWAQIKTVIVCNTTGSATTYSLWINPNSTTTGDDFAIKKIIPIAARASDQSIYPGDSALILRGSSAALIAKPGADASLTITVYGIEIEET
jgi:hypothetical protein